MIVGDCPESRNDRPRMHSAPEFRVLQFLRFRKVNRTYGRIAYEQG